MKNYIVTEVLAKLASRSEGEAFRILLNDQLEICGAADYPNTRKIDMVNSLGCTPDGVYHVNFLGPGEDFAAFENAVRNFLEQFQQDLKNEEYQDDFLTLLEEEPMPNFNKYEVLVTRKFQE